MYHFNIFHERNETEFSECAETVERFELIPPGMLSVTIDKIINKPDFNEQTDWVNVTAVTVHSEPSQTGYDGKQSRQAQASIVSEPYELYGSEAFQREFYARTGVPFAQRWREVGKQMEKLHGQAEGSEQACEPTELPIVSREEFLANWQRTIDRMEGSEQASHVEKLRQADEAWARNLLNEE